MKKDWKDKLLIVVGGLLVTLMFSEIRYAIVAIWFNAPKTEARVATLETSFSHLEEGQIIQKNLSCLMATKLMKNDQNVYEICKNSKGETK